MKNSLINPLILFSVMLILVFALHGLTSYYYVAAPGGVHSLAEMITVNGTRRTEAGGFYATTTISPKTNWAILLVGAFSPSMDIVPFSTSITQEQFRLMMLDMGDSKKEATRTALKETGKLNPGIEILEILKDSPLSKIARPGDTIVKVEEINHLTTGHLASFLASKKIGDKINVIIEDSMGERAEHRVNLTSHIDRPLQPALRIVTMAAANVLPPNIKINTEGIEGPSAGLMFALEIIDRLKPQNLTGGQRIAGTGILIKGEVFPVGGIKQKVVSAEQEGLDLFFVPYGNYDEALQVAKKIAVVPIKDIGDALRFLQKLNEK